MTSESQPHRTVRPSSNPNLGQFYAGNRRAARRCCTALSLFPPFLTPSAATNSSVSASSTIKCTDDVSVCSHQCCAAWIISAGRFSSNFSRPSMALGPAEVATVAGVLADGIAAVGVTVDEVALLELAADSRLARLPTGGCSSTSMAFARNCLSRSSLVRLPTTWTSSSAGRFPRVDVV